MGISGNNVTEDLSNVTSIINLSPELISQVSFLMNILKALGGIFVIYIIFYLVNFIFSRKRQKELEKINRNLEEIKEILKKEK